MKAPFMAPSCASYNNNNIQFRKYFCRRAEREFECILLAHPHSISITFTEGDSVLTHETNSGDVKFQSLFCSALSDSNSHILSITHAYSFLISLFVPVWWITQKPVHVAHICTCDRMLVGPSLLWLRLCLCVSCECAHKLHIKRISIERNGHIHRYCCIQLEIYFQRKIKKRVIWN